jgi:hypothetical protein
MATAPQDSPHDCFAHSPPAARDVARGVTRLFFRQDLFAMCEVPLPNGRRADMMAIDAKGCLTIVEIKVSRADLRGDGKWPDYLDYCDRFFWAVPGGFALDLFETEDFRPNGRRPDRRRPLRRSGYPRACAPSTRARAPEGRDAPLRPPRRPPVGKRHRSGTRRLLKSAIAAWPTPWRGRGGRAAPPGCASAPAGAGSPRCAGPAGHNRVPNSRPMNPPCRIGAVGDQHAHHVEVLVLHRNDQRRFTPGIGAVDLGPARNQHPRALGIAEPRGKAERRIARICPRPRCRRRFAP